MSISAKVQGAYTLGRQLWVRVGGQWRKAVYSFCKASGAMRPVSNYRNSINVRTFVNAPYGSNTLSIDFTGAEDLDISFNGSGDLLRITDVFTLNVSKSGVIRTAELRVRYPFPPNTTVNSAGIMIFGLGGGVAAGSILVKDQVSVGGGGITIKSQSSFDGSDPGNNRGFGASVDALLASVGTGNWRVYVYLN